MVVVLVLSFLFAVVRDVQRNRMNCDWQEFGDIVSIRCRARRTAERRTGHPEDVGVPRFYSLSCETYSGTGAEKSIQKELEDVFLFAVVRDVQRNSAPAVPEPTAAYTPVSIRCRARRTAEPGPA